MVMVVQSECPEDHRIVHLKIVKMVNFVMYILSQKKKRKKTSVEIACSCDELINKNYLLDKKEIKN